MTIDESQRPAVLAALYNRSRPVGLGFLNATPGDMSVEEAATILAERLERYRELGIEKDVYFDYLNGRVMKIKLGDGELDFCGYDRDNGQGAGERTVRAVLEGQP